MDVSFLGICRFILFVFFLCGLSVLSRLLFLIIVFSSLMKDFVSSVCSNIIFGINCICYQWNMITRSFLHSSVRNFLTHCTSRCRFPTIFFIFWLLFSEFSYGFSQRKRGGKLRIFSISFWKSPIRSFDIGCFCIQAILGTLRYLSIAVSNHLAASCLASLCDNDTDVHRPYHITM